MNVICSERIRQSGSLLRLVQQAADRLEEVIGSSAGLVTAEWDQSDDGRGRAVVTLRLSDWTGAVVASFAPDELEDASRLHVRLHRLWGDLLQARSHKQLQELLKSVDASSGS
jgi:hypothetical protein